eukprot:ANDGO_05454.mRNA.1 hypothetical protein
MGAFVCEIAAGRYADRMEGLVLLDAGYPVDTPQEYISPDLIPGVVKALDRLKMTFKNLAAYLEYWFGSPVPDESSLDVDQLESFRHELLPVEAAEHTEGSGFKVKHDLAIVGMDIAWQRANLLKAAEFRKITVPVAVVVAEFGFKRGGAPIVHPVVYDQLCNSLFPDVRMHRRIAGSTHYSLLWSEHSRQVVDALFDFVHSLEIAVTPR